MGASSRADAHGEADLIGPAALCALIPSETGISVSHDGPPRVAAVLGWSEQILLGPEPLFSASDRHRIVIDVDLLRTVGSTFLRGRIGYRYAWRDLIVGLGSGIDARGYSLSPELGFKFEHADVPVSDVDLSLHLRARADLDTHGLREAALLVGWNFF